MQGSVAPGTVLVPGFEDVRCETGFRHLRTQAPGQPPGGLRCIAMLRSRDNLARIRNRPRTATERHGA